MFYYLYYCFSNSSLVSYLLGHTCIERSVSRYRVSRDSSVPACISSAWLGLNGDNGVCRALQNLLGVSVVLRQTPAFPKYDGRDDPAFEGEAWPVELDMTFVIHLELDPVRNPLIFHVRSVSRLPEMAGIHTQRVYAAVGDLKRIADL